PRGLLRGLDQDDRAHHAERKLVGARSASLRVIDQLHIVALRKHCIALPLTPRGIPDDTRRMLMGTKTYDLKALDDELNGMILQGQALDAMHKFYDEDCAMQENN